MSVSPETLQWVRPPQQVRSQKTFERLLDAAEDLVIERGFERTTVADVVRRAGSSVGAFYTRFPDKEALLHCLLQRFLDQSQATIDAGLDPERWHGTPLRDVVAALVQFTLRVFTERRLLIAALQRMLADDLALSATFRQVVAARIIERLSELLRARRTVIGRPSGRKALHILVWMILGAFESAAVQGTEGPSDIDPEELGREIADLALSYLVLEDQGESVKQ